MNKNTRSLLESWLKEGVVEREGHRRARRRLNKARYFLGLPAAVLSSCVAILTSLNLGSSLGHTLLVSASYLAAVFSTIYAFTRPDVKTVEHQDTYIKLLAYTKSLERLLSNNTPDEDLSSEIDELSKQHLAVMAKAPPLSMSDKTAKSAIAANSAQH